MIKRILIPMLVLVLFAAAFLAYSSSFKNEFVWDDTHFILNDPNIRQPGRAAELISRNIGYGGGSRNNFYRPVFSLANMVDYLRGKGSPAAFHVTNTFIHASCAVVVFLLFLRICDNVFISFSTALLFLLHPVQTQAVTYISGRADPLYALFGCSSLLLALIYVSRPEKKRFLFCAVFALSLALLSKETALIFPVLLALVLYSKDRLKSYGASFSIMVCFVSVSLLYVISRKTILDFSSTAFAGLTLETPPLLTRFLTACKAVFMYFRFIFFPAGFQMETHLAPSRALNDPVALIAAGGCAGLLWLLIRSRKKDPPLFLGLGWFLACLLPVLNIFPINAFISVHWLYLPCAGIFYAIGYLAWKWLTPAKNKRPVIFTALLLSVSIALGGLTFIKNTEWKDEKTLYINILKYSQTPRVYVNLGNIYIREGDLPGAEECYLKAIAIAPGQTEAYVNLGYIYTTGKQYDKAAKVLKKALEISPSHTGAHFNLAALYLNTGKRDLAEKELESVLRINPNKVPALNALGKLYLAKRRIKKGLQLLERSLSVDPDQKDISSLVSRINKQFP